MKQLLNHLQGRWTSLATHRVGYHTVQKVFAALHDVKDKEKLVQELVGGNNKNDMNKLNNRLTSNNMGRTIRTELLIQEYETLGVSEWTKLINKKYKEYETSNQHSEKRSNAQPPSSPSLSKKRKDRKDVNVEDTKSSKEVEENDKRREKKRKNATGASVIDSIFEISNA